jgi:sigma-70-like protein
VRPPVAGRRRLTELNELPVRQRDALLSTALHGIPRARVASRMGLSDGAVRQLVHRARSALREAVPAALPYPLLRALGLAGGDGAGVATSALSGTDSGGALVKLGAVLASGVIATGFAVDEVSQAPGHHHVVPARPTMVSKRHRGHGRSVPITAAARAPIDPSARTTVSGSDADDGRLHGDDAELGTSRARQDDGGRQEPGRRRGDGGGGRRGGGHEAESPGDGPRSPGSGGREDPGGSPGGGPTSGGSLNGDSPQVAGTSSGGDDASGDHGSADGGGRSSGGGASGVSDSSGGGRETSDSTGEGSSGSSGAHS